MQDALLLTPRCWQDANCRIRRWRAQREGLNAEIGSLQQSCLPLHQTTSLHPHQHPGHHMLAHLQLCEGLSNLCLQLVDYLSTGHFVIFRQLLLAFPSPRHPLFREVKVLYRGIELCTDHALGFNDKYDAEPLSIQQEPRLPQDLAHLARILELRYTLEDRLVVLAHDELSLRESTRAEKN